MTAIALPPLLSFEVPELISRRFPFGWAIAASLLLHGVALGWLPGLQKAQTFLAEPLRVFMPAPPPEAAVPPAPTLRPADPVPNSRPAQRQEQRSLPTPVLTRAQEDHASAAPSFPVPAPVETLPAAVEPPRQVTPPPPPRVAGPDPATLSAYGKSVAGAVAAHQKYPRLAMMRQWQGTTLLQLELAADGQLRDVRVVSSSGHEILDRQAIDMVRAALPLPPLPASLADRSLTIDVPVVFRLAS